MGLKLEQVVPWGRSLDEYLRMFALTSEDMQLKILDVAAGPASFNAEMNDMGYYVVSCDPIYQFTTGEICQRIEETYPVIIQGATEHHEDYIWDAVTSPTQLGQVRMAAMQQFLDDFSFGLEEKRYINASLPALPFADNEFDLVLCSHFLLSYSDHLSLDFHLAAIEEMCRLAREVRIFPLLTISGQISPFLTSIVDEFKARAYFVKIEQVAYEFQKGGNQLLRIRRNK